MNEPLRRCVSCEHVYDAPAGAPCPQCNAPGEEIGRVHYLVPADGPIQTGVGPRMLACQPARARLPRFATGRRQQVTCPKCRASAIFTEDERDGVTNDAGGALRQAIAAKAN